MHLFGLPSARPTLEQLDRRLHALKRAVGRYSCHVSNKLQKGTQFLELD